MGGQGKQIGGLALALMGVLGVCVTCGLPMWRETSFVGANIVTAQSVWDGLWFHCILQATGQMQCRRHNSYVTMTSDLEAGRALTLISIIAGFLGFIITLLGGGVVNCSGAPQDPYESPSSISSKKKVTFLLQACLVGGVLCILAGILCLISVSWSAAATISVANDPFVAPAMKREVGSSVYIGFASSVLLLLGGILMCLVCGEEEKPTPSYYSYMPYTTNSQYSDTSSRVAMLRPDNARPNSLRMADRPVSRVMEHTAQVHNSNSFRRTPNEVGVYNA
ncbi:claudin-4-like [Cheilinus undulatus]|uniref:claudin-4-like n=1 Tax=Cheilinus undulatus TaxID=241271 RepID=UPI001BD6D851|nr:claudin-4-like [Cheilinus undulatus]